MEIAPAVAEKLLQINAIKLSPQNPFTWASGLKSPIYCDNRITLSYPEIRRFLIDCFVKKAGEMGKLDLVAGVATAGIPHGALIADRLQLPFVYVRSKAKAHGRQNLIEGRIPEGKRTLVVEDLISTGGSSLKAVEALRAEGCQIAGVMAIFSYGFDQAAQAFTAANCPISTLSNYESLIEIAAQEKKITSSELTLLQSWSKNPLEWSNQQS